eukprot:TRINITY_DN18833_c0_g1_i1.p1 TRINITY_DN18833_c0_g1~~TRINITY_DN18833_c0_g1_i1.p1  ORF type:complete len:446 (-),score=173.75 TRINITY_DN18833_c0_g1_i1:382-1719(-)
MADSSKLPLTAKDVREKLHEHMLVDGFHLVMDLEKSHGSWIYDALAEREILDCYTSFATVPCGYNHPKLLTEDFQKKILPAALNNIANADIYTTQMAEFVNSFSRTIPEEFKYYFFVAGGALAVENALKTAFDWKVRKNIKAGKGEKGSKIIHFKEAFHGRSGYTMSLTNTDPKKVAFFPKFDWPRITNPKLKFTRGEVTEDDLKAVIELEKQAVREIEEAVRANPDDIAGLIVEPIQGEGGDNHFRPEFLAELRRLADLHDFLLIFDEVQCGFGTSGKWWAFQHFGVLPDVFAFGKKTQVCGICARPERLDEVDNVFKVSSRINSTWGGNIVDMVRCQRYIEIIEEENLLDRVTQTGKQLLDGLIAFEGRFPVTNARGKGAFVALDLPDTEVRNKLLGSFYEHGMLALSSGTRSVRFRGPLTMTSDEISELLRRIEKTFSDMWA